MNFLKGMGGAAGTGGVSKSSGGSFGNKALGESAKTNYFTSLKLKYMIINKSSEP